VTILAIKLPRTVSHSSSKYPVNHPPQASTTVSVLCFGLLPLPGSGSPGISGPLVPGRRFGVSKNLNPVVDLFFEFVSVDEVINQEVSG
jgi:hypothetical protein